MRINEEEATHGRYIVGWTVYKWMVGMNGEAIERGDELEDEVTRIWQ